MPGRSYYVETSVWGMIPKGQPREMRRASLRFLRRQLQFFASPVALYEIGACAELARAQIMEVFDALQPTILEVTAGIEELAGFYIETGIVAKRKRPDALHVAVATVHEMDVLVSWNHRHIANIRKTEQYRGANLIRGYSNTPQILTPIEVLHA